MEETKNIIKKDLNKEFISTKELINKTWEIFQERIGKFLRIIVMQMAAGLILGIFLVLGLLISIGSAIDFGKIRDIDRVFENLNAESFAIFGILAMLLILIFIVFMIFLTITNIQIINNDKESSLAEIFKSSFPLILPYIGTSALVTILVLGGSFLFIIPGIIIGIFLAFSLFEIVLGKTKKVEAMRNSYKMIKQNFGWFLKKIAILFLIFLGITLLLDIFSNNNLFFISFLSEIVSFVFSLVSPFLSLIYSILVYKQIKKNTDFNQENKFSWIVITSIIGWILGIFVMFFSFNLFKGIIEKIEKELFSKYGPEDQYRVNFGDDKYDYDFSEEYLEE